MVKYAMILVLVSSYSLSQWYTQQSGTVSTIRSVHFINLNTGFAAGFNSVLKTANSGENWNVIQVTGLHNCILFVNSATGFMCSDSGRILKTTNSGIIWTELVSGTFNNLMRITFLNENTGLCVGFNRTILRTTNAGLNWQSLISNIDTLNFLGCGFISQSSYIVTGTSSSIYLSTNSGVSWNPSTLGLVNPLWAPEFINENTGWITGCCGIFIKTTNAGLSWSPDIYLTLGNTVYTMDFINASTGYLCGDDGILYRTTNAGDSWDSTVTGTNQILYSLFMVNSNTGWAVGNYGTILKTTNGGGQGFPIGVNLVSNRTAEEFRLYQNYPNPFNPSTKIKFDIYKPGFVELIIYDVLGSEVARLINRSLSAGIYVYELDLTAYSSGVYFYKIAARNFGETVYYSETRKLVLIK